MFFPLNIELSLDKKLFSIKVKDGTTEAETTFVGNSPKECVDKLNKYVEDYFEMLIDCKDVETEQDCFQIY